MCMRPQVGKLTDPESRVVAARGWEGAGDLGCSGHRVSVSEDGKFWR